MKGNRLRCFALAIITFCSGATFGVENPMGLPEKALASEGSLLICGGGRTPDEVYTEFVRLAGGKDARLVVIPTAYPFSSIDAARRRYAGWREYGAKSLDFLDAKTRAQADSETFAKALSKASGVWMTGGYQSRLAGIYGGTKAEAALRGIVERGGVVGGTSAGAAAMSLVMIRSGRAENVVIDRGLGLLQGGIVDQHFTQRNRKTRLLFAVEQHRDKFGLGIDEGTAVVVQGNRLRVIGSHNATLVLSKPDRTTTVHTLEATDKAELIAGAAEGGIASLEFRRLAE